MKIHFTVLLALLFTAGFSQPVHQYFEKIRNNEVALTAFFAQMPKGGDLHHHYSGSIYAEPLLAYAIQKDFYLNTSTMQVAKNKAAEGKWEKFSALQQQGLLEHYKQQVMQRWSVKDYNHVDYPSDKLFFETFDKMGEVVDDNFEKGLLELKNRAIQEKVSYIETQLSTIPCAINTQEIERYNAQLQQAGKVKDEKAVFQLLDSLFTYFSKKNIDTYANDFNKAFVEKLHYSLKIDEDRFVMRYQNYVLRFMQPVELFKNLLVSFISANNSSLIVGVNIVSPEDGETSMKDYWLHMLMYQYCHKKFPAVKYSMHAGELTLGLVQPEELSWHIRSAVHIAKANRIGHGVDIAYEENSYDLLRYMAKQKIAVEINLVSNEFILKVKENRHPISLYKAFGVPIVISTDDAGVLRTNMTEQYVLLAKRYPEFSYRAIKQLVLNSIDYSFIEEPAVKNKLRKKLEKDFQLFEAGFPLK